MTKVGRNVELIRSQFHLRVAPMGRPSGGGQVKLSLGCLTDGLKMVTRGDGGMEGVPPSPPTSMICGDNLPVMQPRAQALVAKKGKINLAFGKSFIGQWAWAPAATSLSLVALDLGTSF